MSEVFAPSLVLTYVCIFLVSMLVGAFIGWLGSKM